MYDVLDICKYIITYCRKNKHYNLSNLRIQQILYFIQVVFIYNNYENCFEDNIEAWGLGPVIPKAHNKYKFIIFDFMFQYVDLGDFEIEKIDKQHREIINNLLDLLKDYHVSELLKIIKEQTPYKKAFQEYKDRIIKMEDIKEYYK